MLTYLSTLRLKTGFFLVRPEKCVFCKFAQHQPSPSLRSGEFKEGDATTSSSWRLKLLTRKLSAYVGLNGFGHCPIGHENRNLALQFTRILTAISISVCARPQSSSRNLQNFRWYWAEAESDSKRKRNLAFTRRGGRSPERAERGREAPGARDASPSPF